MPTGCYSCHICNRSKRTHPEFVYHKFPEDKERCLRWKQVILSLATTDKTVEDLHCHFLICSNHFSRKNYINKTRLQSDACPDQNLVAKASSIDYVASVSPPINIDTIAGMEMTFGSVNTSIDENVSGAEMIAMHSPDKQKIRNPLDFLGSSLGEVIEVKEECFEFTQEATEVAEEDPLMVKKTEAGFSTSSFASHCGDAFGLNSRNAEKNNSLRTEVSIKDEPIESEEVSIKDEPIES